MLLITTACRVWIILLFPTTLLNGLPSFLDYPEISYYFWFHWISGGPRISASRWRLTRWFHSSLNSVKHVALFSVHSFIFAWHFLSRTNLFKHFLQSDLCSIFSDLNIYYIFIFASLLPWLEHYIVHYTSWNALWQVSDSIFQPFLIQTM